MRSGEPEPGVPPTRSPALSFRARPARLVLALAGGFALAAGCTPDAAAGPTVERRDSAGVEIVTVGPEDRPLDWSLERLLVLGGEEEGPEGFYRVWGSYVTVDEEDRIYVLDAEASRIVVFDTAGTFLREMGGEGEGPGELINPLTVRLEGDSVVAVYDFRDRTLERFGLDGAPLGPTRPGWMPNPAVERKLRSVRDGWAVLAYAAGDEGPEVRLLRVDRDDSVSMHAIPRPLGEWVESRECGVRFRLPPIFHPEIAFDAADDRVVWNGAHPYRIRVRDGGADVREIRRELPVRSATRDDALAHVGEGMQVGVGGRAERCLIEAETLVEGRGHATTVPWLASLDLASDGTIWARRFAVPAGARGPIDLFAPDGDYLGTLRSDFPQPLAFLSGDRFLAAETDELDVQRLVLYRIDRSGGGS